MHESVPKNLADDYREAHAVIDLSPKASAALGRRCLEYILVHAAGLKDGNLAHKVAQVLKPGELPSYISENVDAIRKFGNFAAHASIDKFTGDIISVEPGEAQWTLAIVRELLDHYYVGPARSKARRDAFQQRLADMGKEPMKTPEPPPF